MKQGGRQSSVSLFTLLTQLITLLFFTPVLFAQTFNIPLPDSRLVREEFRRQTLRLGIVPAGSLTLRAYHLDYLDISTYSSSWLDNLSKLWIIPDGNSPVRIRAETGFQYSPQTLKNGYRELRVSEEMSFLTIRGVAAGENWEFLMEADFLEKWIVEGNNWWNLPRHKREIDRQFLRRASLGINIGPFLVEFGRLGRDWSVGRTGGLTLGREVRCFDGVALEASNETWTFELLYAALEPGLTDEERAVIPGLGREAFINNEKSIYLHRISWRPGPNIRLGLTEGAIFYGRRPTIADLGPVLIQHDQYRNYDNLMFSFDGLWFPKPGLGLYAELAIDDIKAPTELETSDPSSLGFLAGAESLSGPWEAYIEAVWTSERLYRARHPLARWESRRRFGTLTNSWIRDYDQPLGHWIGPDAAALFIGINRILSVDSQRSPAKRGIMPASMTRIGAHLSYRLHKSLHSQVGIFSQPVDLGNPDDPALSKAAIATASLTFDCQLWNSGWLEGGITGIYLKSEPLFEMNSQTFSISGIEYRLGLKWFLL